MKILGKIHEILKRRIDKDNPDSDYYEIYPITVMNAVYLDENRDQTLGELLTDLESSFDTFVDHIEFPVTSVQVHDGTQFGPIKKGDIKLTAKDFGLDHVDNTPDSEKPVSEPQKSFLSEYVTNITKQIGATLDNVDSWNAHLTDYNNPHRVTWEQIAPNTTVTPENLVDRATLDDLVKQHNESVDLSTLHPHILDQIHAMQSQLDSIEHTIQQLDTNIDDTVSDVVRDVLNDHNTDPQAHRAILDQLAKLSSDIDDTIREFSGLTGVEQTINKVNEIDLPTLERTADGDTTSPFSVQYPSVLGIKNLMEQLKVSTFTHVDHLTDAPMSKVEEIKNTNSSGILFVDHLDGNAGTHIFVYANGEFLVEYNLPEPSKNFEVIHVEKAPTEQAAINAYGDRHVLLLCDKSSYTPDDAVRWNQSICVYYSGKLEEWDLDKVYYDGEANVWEVLCANDNNTFDFDTMFISGKGLLFCDSLYMMENDGNVMRYVHTGRPGVVMYQKTLNPAYDSSQPISPTNLKYLYDYKCIPLGGNTRNVIMKEHPVQPTQKEVMETLFPPDGTGLVYVNNMFTADSGVPGFECWYMGEKKFEKAIHSLAQDHFEYALTGTGGAVSHTFTLTKPFVKDSLRVLAVVGGFNTNTAITVPLTITANVTNITDTTVTVSFTVTNGVWAKFLVTAVGVLQ